MKRSSVLRSGLVLVCLASLALPMAANDALSLVPANAVTVGVVKLSEMRSSPLSGMLFQQMDQVSADGEAAKFLAEAGLAPAKDVDLLVVATAPRTQLGADAEILVIAEGRFHPERLSAALIERGAVKKGAYLLFPEKSETNQKGAVAFPTSSLAVAGSETAVAAALEARTAGGTGFLKRGTLGLDVSRVDPAATAWAIIDVPRAARLSGAGNLNTGNGGPAEALQAALRTVSTVALWATDTGDALKLGAIGLSSDGETLQLVEDTIRGGLSAMRLAAREKSPEMVSVLRRFEVSRKSNSVTIEGSIPASTLRQVMAKKTAAAVR